MKQTFTGRVRKIMQELGAGGREFGVQEVAVTLDMVSNEEKRPLYNCINTLRKAGEIQRVRPGVLLYKGRKKGAPEVQEVMWRILRARRTVTIEDLMELAGASHAYAKEWLGMLRRRTIISRTDFPGNKPSKFTMIKDPVQMPLNDAKSDRIRQMRAEKKKAMAALDAAYTNILEARIAINSIPEDT
jgi:hypothetical protein